MSSVEAQKLSEARREFKQLIGNLDLPRVILLMNVDEQVRYYGP